MPLSVKPLYSMIFRIVAGLGLIALLPACAPNVYTAQRQPAQLAPQPSTAIYFYPARGQNPAQIERDRYECYLWAVQQSGFDPGQAQLAPHQRVEVRPATPPGADVAAGAFSGAVLGSMLAMPRDRAEGMIFGAITGAILGAASESARQQQAQQIQQQYDARDAQRYSRLERQARDYRRAMAACLEGRGYTVQ